MTLHEAIMQLLNQQGYAMTTKEIANSLNNNGWYIKKDGSPIQAFQIHGRTRNYPHLFERDGSMVSLKSKVGNEHVIAVTKPTPKITKVLANHGLLVSVLMNEKNFKPASIIDDLVPDKPGLYCIRVSNPQSLRQPFNKVLTERKHNIVYIGIASQSLKKRFLGQELRARGHGTFFRSLGAILGYRPESGSLKNKKNQNNYTFSLANEKKIITWINQSILVNWVALEGNLNGLEDDLIKEYLPLLNIAGNPGRFREVIELRDECKRIGRGRN